MAATVTRSWKQPAKQVFFTSSLVQDTIISCELVFSILIGDLKSKIGPAPFDKKCWLEHQTLFALVKGLGNHGISEDLIWYQALNILLWADQGINLTN